MLRAPTLIFNSLNPPPGAASFYWDSCSPFFCGLAPPLDPFLGSSLLLPLFLLAESWTDGDCELLSSDWSLSLDWLEESHTSVVIFSVSSLSLGSFTNLELSTSFFNYPSGPNKLFPCSFYNFRSFCFILNICFFRFPSISWNIFKQSTLIWPCS